MMFKKTSLNIGLDIGSGYIKVVKLEKDNNHYTIKDFIQQRILSQNNLSAVLKEIIEKIKATSIPLNISLSGQNVVCRYLNLPLMQDNEFKNALRFEISKYIPFQLPEVYFDGFILKKDITHNKMLVLMVAAKKEFVNQRIALIKNLGYQLKTIDIDCLAMVNCFNFNFSDKKYLDNKTVGVLNIGASFSNLSIVENGIPVLSRDIRIAGNEITTRISTDLSCDFETAEKIKLEATEDEDQFQKIKPSLENVLSLLAQELRISFDYYESQSVSTVERLYVCGGQLMLKSVAEILGHYLGVEIVFWNPLEGFDFAKDLNKEELKANHMHLAVALGLGLR